MFRHCDLGMVWHIKLAHLDEENNIRRPFLFLKSSTHDIFLMCESTETRNKNLESYQCDLHLVSYLAKRFFFFFFNVPTWSSACWEIKNAWLRHSPEFKRHLSIRSSDAFGWINPDPWNLVNLGWSIKKEFLKEKDKARKRILGLRLKGSHQHSLPPWEVWPG